MTPGAKPAVDIGERIGEVGYWLVWLLGLMAALVIVTVLAVAVAMYFVADWFARPIKLVIEAMAEIGRGHFEHRIAEPRKDEFGLLYAAFDQMAQSLQDARSGAGALPATSAAPPDGAP